ncbi:MAG: divalent-cation tolerance protein CutA [Burkholderiales bacterium]|nr:divalent-cation tolerance protein CutA [Burkholderiales bacterium]
MTSDERSSQSLLDTSDESNSVVLVMTNCPSMDVAKELAEVILTKKLAACVNILPQVQSMYTWRGQREVATEVPLMIKTMQTSYLALQELLLQIHPYELPEIIALPITDGLPAYLQWVKTETGRS